MFAHTKIQIKHEHIAIWLKPCHFKTSRFQFLRILVTMLSRVDVRYRSRQQAQEEKEIWSIKVGLFNFQNVHNSNFVSLEF